MAWPPVPTPRQVRDAQGVVIALVRRMVAGNLVVNGAERTCRTAGSGPSAPNAHHIPGPASWRSVLEMLVIGFWMAFPPPRPTKLWGRVLL